MKKSEIRIFLAYAKENKAQVIDIYKKLKKEGYSPWLDEENLLPGQLWNEEIQKAIKSSHFFIACLSKQSISKEGYIQSEFRLALLCCAEKPRGSIYLIPLKLDNSEIPDLRQDKYGIALRDYQWVNYYQPNGFEQLVKAFEYQRNKLNVTYKISYNYDKQKVLPDSETRYDVNSLKGNDKKKHLRKPNIRLTVIGAIIIFLAGLTSRWLTLNQSPKLADKSIKLATVFDPPSNVRATPNGTVLCSIDNIFQITIDGPAKVDGYEGDWYYTNICDGTRGVIHASQLKFSSNKVADFEPPYTTAYGVAIVSHVPSYVRDKPDGKTLCLTDERTTTKIYGRIDNNNNWFYTDFCDGKMEAIKLWSN